MQGKCRLCGKDSVLINSHLMPRSVYKATRCDGSRNNGLIVMDASDAAYSDKQVTQYLLCSCCEDLFNRNGERYFSSIWNTGDGFNLRESLSGATPESSDGVTSFYYPDSVPDVDSLKIYYLALSIIWRASFSGWKYHNASQISLGSYKDNVGDYLLGRCAALDSIFVLVYVDPDDSSRGAVIFPSSMRRSDGWCHGFRSLGIGFQVYIGSSGKCFMERFGPSNGFRHMAYIVDPEIGGHDKSKLAKLARRVKRRGRLGKEYPN